MSKIKIKALIFDIGNVLFFYDTLTPARKMAKYLGISTDKIFRFLSGYSPGNKAFFKISEKKNNSSKEYWEIAAKVWGVKKIPHKKFDFYWNVMHSPNKNLLKILKKLRKKYKTGILSNLAPHHKKNLLKKYKISKIVDVSLYSCDIAARKPERKAFRIVLKKLDVKPSQTIFIDDMESHVVGAKKAGLKTILFKNNKQLFRDLKKFGVNT